MPENTLPEQPSYSKMRIHLVAIGLALLLAALGTTLYFYKTADKTPVQPTQQTLPTKTNSNIQVVHPDPLQSFIELFYTKDSGEEIVIYTGYARDNSKSIAKHENALYFEDLAKNIQKFDLETKSFETIFTLEEASQLTGNDDLKSDFYKERNESAVIYLEIINGDLYVAYGGYLTGGGLFKIDLTSQTKNVIKEGSYVQIEEFDNNYFLVELFGDGCFSSGKYTSINLDTLELGEEYEFGSNCGKGNILLGYDPKTNVFYEQELIVDENSPSVEPHESLSVLIKINALDSDGEKTLFLDVQNVLNEKIRSAVLAHSENKIYLASEKSLYEFFTNNRVVRKIGEFNANLTEIYLTEFIETGGLCARVTTEDPVISTLKFVDHTTAKFVNANDSLCEKPKQKTTQDFIEELDLPATFKIHEVNR